MSKIVFSLLALLILQLGIFIQPTLAVGSCESSKINWTPRSFPEGSTEITINFQIRDPNVLDNIKSVGKSVKLVVSYGAVNLGRAASNEIPVETHNFSLKITDPNLLQRRVYNGTLQYADDTSIICNDVIYQIGAVGEACTIDPKLEEKIPPRSQLTIKFIGMADQEYLLLHDLGAFGGQLDRKRTGLDGQGRFSNIAIPGNHGDRVWLTVKSVIGGSTCYKDIRIDNSASPPRPPTVDTVEPRAVTEAVKQCPKKGEAFDPARHLEKGQCTRAGGEECDSNPHNPGILTAIGCIHTSPAEFAKDFLKFAIGIGGGLAFLMMLVGAFQMLTSAGNPDSLKAGQDRLTSAVIGLLFVIFATLFLQIIGFDILKLPGFGR